MTRLKINWASSMRSSCMRCMRPGIQVILGFQPSRQSSSAWASRGNRRDKAVQLCAKKSNKTCFDNEKHCEVRLHAHQSLGWRASNSDWKLQLLLSELKFISFPRVFLSIRETIKLIKTKAEMRREKKNFQQAKRNQLWARRSRETLFHASSNFATF